MSNAFEAQSLTKSYGGERGITDVTLAMPPGEVLGLVGVNGAGKSTFMRTLMDFIRPSSGSISVFGHELPRESVQARSRCTYLPGELVLPARLTGWQVMSRFSFARPDVSNDRVEQLANRLEVDLGRKVGDLSKGNRQKVGLILAFAPGADLLVLDEPTSGLDPVLQRTFAELVEEAAGDGRAVLLSSHVMGQVEQIANRVALLKEGRLVLVDELSSLLARSRRRGVIHPQAVDDVGAIAVALRSVPGVENVVAGEGTVEFACQGDMDPLLKVLARFAITSLDVAHADLEDAFFAITDGDSQ